MKYFTNREGTTVPERTNADKKVWDETPPAEYRYRPSNYWCRILEMQANARRIVELSEAEAQLYADMGYVVVVSWKNERTGDYSPHFATVRPGFEVHERDGVMLANVGANNGIMRRRGGVGTISGFGRISPTEIHYYYNPAQQFQYKPERVLNYLSYK